jgi:transposase
MVGQGLLYYRLMSTTDRNRSISWREGRRRRAWELHQMGWTQQQIARALGVTQGAVSQWLKRATLHGVQALRDHPAPGPTPLLGMDERTQLVGLLAQGAEAFGFRGAVWTCRRVARLIREQFGVSYHPAHVSRLLAQLDWSPQKPIVRARQRDEEAIAEWYGERWPALKKRHDGKGELSCG